MLFEANRDRPGLRNNLCRRPTLIGAARRVKLLAALDFGSCSRKLQPDWRFTPGQPGPWSIPPMKRFVTMFRLALAVMFFPLTVALPRSRQPRLAQDDPAKPADHSAAGCREARRPEQAAAAAFDKLFDEWKTRDQGPAAAEGEVSIGPRSRPGQAQRRVERPDRQGKRHARRACRTRA